MDLLAALLVLSLAGNFFLFWKNKLYKDKIRQAYRDLKARLISETRFNQIING
jgi:hypothetical protein